MTGDPLLRTRDLSKQFGKFVALDRVNFEVGHGELRGVIGPNGAGKTTFFNLIAGVLDETSGTVTFDGEKSPPFSQRTKSSCDAASLRASWSPPGRATIMVSLCSIVLLRCEVDDPRVVRVGGVADEAGTRGRRVAVPGQTSVLPGSVLPRFSHPD